MTCGQCGSPMRQQFMFLTLATGCERVPSGPPVCTSQECRDRQAIEDRADRQAADERALEAALASGLIVPDDTPEADRWVQP